MSRRWITYSLVTVLVVLAGAVAVFVGGKWYFTRNGSSIDLIHQRLAGVGQRLQEAGSARVTFTADYTPQVAGPTAKFTGTSMVTFGADGDNANTEYTSIEASGVKETTAESIRVGDKVWLTTPAIKPDDGRRWIGPGTARSFGNILADPTSGLADFTVWKPFLTKVTRNDAFQGYDSEKVPDLPGAPHKYEVLCGVSVVEAISTSCPPPLPDRLGDLFNAIGSPLHYLAWIDDDGLLRKLEVYISMAYLADLDTFPPAGGHPKGEYYARVAFTLDQFGAPVTVTAPDDADVTTARGVVRSD
ncbi:hypothetical protein [Actinoplanes rectilineatus]|uniref:hypothetical protein n=1 Tax=Actinoplanes rectilineatus TaxID=113571 RepID=UPI0005F2C328|nr:hypothetical protein [Actinoplanes rectilineatus]